jgi:ABC-type phosphate transport system substrate-binding protein
MKWMQLVIVCAVMLAFVGCDSSTSQSIATPETNAPAAQAAPSEPVLDGAKAAVPATTSTSEVVIAPAPTPTPGQN